MVKRPPSAVHQFLIVLIETNPLVWRRMLVPSGGTFWDLHVAIQDAMGWDDTQLHEFRLAGPGGKSEVRIGVPTDMSSDFDLPIVPGWSAGVDPFFEEPGTSARYLYDFGDGWQHVVTFEGSQARVKGAPIRVASAALEPVRLRIVAARTATKSS